MFASRDNFLFKLDGKWRGKCGTESERKKGGREATVGIAHEGTISG